MALSKEEQDASVIVGNRHVRDAYVLVLNVFTRSKGLWVGRRDGN
jgi:hypothetical protein